MEMRPVRMLSGGVVNMGVSPATSGIGLALGSVNGAVNATSRSPRSNQLAKGGSHHASFDAEQHRGRDYAGHPDSDSDGRKQHRDRLVQGCVDASGDPQITATNTVIMRISVERVARLQPCRQRHSAHRHSACANAGARWRWRHDRHRRYVSREQASQDRTPGLHRIPLLGWLFQRNEFSDESRELLIFITPKIMRL